MIKELLAIHEAKCKTQIMKVAEGQEDLGLTEIVDKYIDANRMYHWEGSRGVSNFDKLINVIGYRDLDEFLSNNSGCLEAMVDWIKDARGTDWAEKIQKDLPDDIKESKETMELWAIPMSNILIKVVPSLKAKLGLGNMGSDDGVYLPINKAIIIEEAFKAESYKVKEKPTGFIVIESKEDKKCGIIIECRPTEVEEKNKCIIRWFTN